MRECLCRDRLGQPPTPSLQPYLFGGGKIDLPLVSRPLLRSPRLEFGRTVPSKEPASTYAYCRPPSAMHALVQRLELGSDEVTIAQLD